MSQNAHSNSENIKTVEFKVFRYNPEVDKNPQMETFIVPYTKGLTVLDGLLWIKENLDETLVW